MAEVKIDPETGAPIINPPTTDNPTSDTPTTETTDAVTDAAEPKDMTRVEFMKEVSDILRRYTSDTLSHRKALSEIDDIVPK